MIDSLNDILFSDQRNSAELEKIPFVIGVTGHRDLHIHAINNIRTIVDDFFYGLKRDFPNTRLVIASGLAKGADQMIAISALNAGLELWAILPTSISEYEKDFLPSDNLDQFQKLLSSSSTIINASAENGFEKGFELRPDIYENLRDELCKVSHILIAVWNGINSSEKGGTSDVIHTFLDGLYPQSSIGPISLPACGDVYQIYAPRSNDCLFEVSSKWIFSNSYQPNTAESKDYLQAKLGRANNFLKFIDDYTSTNNKSKESNFTFPNYLMPPEYSWAHDSTMRLLGQWFASADEISCKYAIKRQRALMFVVVNSLLFSLLILSYGGLVDHAWPLIIGLIVLGFTYLFKIGGRYKKIDDYFIFTRGFAEILRIAIIWRACGIRQTISPVLSSAGLPANDSLSMAAKSIDAISAMNSDNFSGENSSSILKYWVDSQLDYFAGSVNKIKHHENRSMFFKWISLSCLMIAGIFYLVTFFVDISDIFMTRNELAKFTAWSVFAFWTSLSLSALSVAYAQVMGHGDHVVEYQKALRKFNVADLNLSKNAVTQELSLELGKASLDEIVYWVITKRRNPVRMPF